MNIAISTIPSCPLVWKRSRLSKPTNLKIRPIHYTANAIINYVVLSLNMVGARRTEF